MINLTVNVGITAISTELHCPIGHWSVALLLPLDIVSPLTLACPLSVSVPLALGCWHWLSNTFVVESIILNISQITKPQLMRATYVQWSNYFFTQTATACCSWGLEVNTPGKKEGETFLPRKGHLLFLSCLSLCSTCEQDGDVCRFLLWSSIINNALAMVRQWCKHVCCCTEHSKRMLLHKKAGVNFMNSPWIHQSYQCMCIWRERIPARFSLNSCLSLFIWMFCFHNNCFKAQMMIHLFKP